MKEVSYFSHDANALTDPKILNMRADYGLEGFGLFWAIVEQLRCEENYSLPRNKNTYRGLKITTNTTYDVEKYIDDCIEEYGLFETSDDKKYFYSCSLKRRMKFMEEKKQARSEAGKKGAEKRWHGDAMANASIEDSNAIFDTVDVPIENSNVIANASQNNSNAMAMLEKDIAKPSKKIANKEINTYITKLNYIFNLIINDDYEKLLLDINEYEWKGFKLWLNRLELNVTKDFMNILSFKRQLEHQIIIITLLKIYKRSFKYYKDKITREDLFHKIEKAQEYQGNVEKMSNEQIKDFMNYYYKCLQNMIDGSDDNAKN